MTDAPLPVARPRDSRLSDAFEYRKRPGSLGLSVAALGGIALLAAVLWTVAPAFALVLLVPALAVSAYQMVVSPVYGLRVSGEGWRLFSEAPDRVIPFADIAHIRFSDREGEPRCTLVLLDGSRVDVPDAAMPEDGMSLLREATARGLRVRQA